MNLRRIDLNLLAVLEALHEEGTVTGAARRLKISQPTLSASLARLRGTFSDKLFVPTAKGMKPTPFATSLRRPIQEILAIVERDIRPKEVFNPKETTRTLTLTTSDAGELCFLPLLINVLSKRAPKAGLECVSLPSSELERALVAGDVDVALGYFPDLKSSALRHQPLFEHPFVCLVREGHPVAREGMSVEDFLAVPHAVVRQKGRSQEIAEGMIDQLGLERRVKVRSPHFLSLPFLIASSDVVSIVPRCIGTAFSDMVRLNMIDPPIALPMIPLAQHWAVTSQSDPATMWLVELIGELFMGMDPTLPENRAMVAALGQ